MFNVAFTGHRDSKLLFQGENDPRLMALRGELREKIIEMISDGATEFFSGMALGVDTYAAEEVLNLKKQYPRINLIAVIPCPDQDKLWTVAQQKRYRDLLAQCSKKMTISPQYEKGCMFKRNRALVELCDVLIAVTDGSNVTGGGTQYTIDYAEKMGRKVIRISV